MSLSALRMVEREVVGFDVEVSGGACFRTRLKKDGKHDSEPPAAPYVASRRRCAVTFGKTLKGEWMKTNGWVEAAESIAPHVVKVEVPDSAGSGFYIAYRTEKKQKFAVIATAAHVVEHAFKWAEPIRLTGHKSTALLLPGQYEIQMSDDLDLAIIEVPWDAVDFPAHPLPTANPKDVLPPGFPVAWCGFPNIVEGINCLFSGHISASVVARGDYLIDGVVIHGVSGGPAFINDGRQIIIIGLLSQYLPNRATGESLPGLGVVRSINPLTRYFDDQAKTATKKASRK